MVRTMPGGVSLGSAAQAGSPFRMVASVSDTSLLSKGRRPASISNSTHPNAQISLRASASLPRACSGLM